MNKFQVILLQDGFKSYVVFIYDCETMKWGGGVIGWQAGIYDYEAHPLSGQTDSNTIGCLYSNKQSAVVYRVCKSCSLLKIYSGTSDKGASEIGTTSTKDTFCGTNTLVYYNTYLRNRDNLSRL